MLKKAVLAFFNTGSRKTVLFDSLPRAETIDSLLP